MADDKKNIPEEAPPAEAPAPAVENTAVPEQPAPELVLTNAEEVMLEHEGQAALFEMGEAVPDPADAVTHAEVEEPAAPEAPKAEMEQAQPPDPGKDNPTPAHSGKVVDFAAARDEAAKEEKKAVKQKPPTAKDKAVKPGLAVCPRTARPLPIKPSRPNLGTKSPKASLPRRSLPWITSSKQTSGTGESMNWQIRSPWCTMRVSALSLCRGIIHLPRQPESITQVPYAGRRPCLETKPLRAKMGAKKPAGISMAIPVGIITVSPGRILMPFGSFTSTPPFHSWNDASGIWARRSKQASPTWARVGISTVSAKRLIFIEIFIFISTSLLLILIFLKFRWCVTH